MTLNKELFVEDPTAKNIPNLGVTKVGEPDDDAALAVLRYELQNFVCNGSYERGLDQILSSYLAQAGKAQSAAWVSGFYGSGKSHLVRVLEQLWRNTQFPDGADARGLTTLPQQIHDHLRELSTLGDRHGGLWSAAGTLDAGAGSVRLAFLSIVLKAAGLPGDLAQAQAVMWLREEGLLEHVRATLERRGLDWEHELDNMYASTLAEAILEAKPGWASGGDTAREQLFNAFPEPTDISLDETVKIIERVLLAASDKPGVMPCALVVLDEVQQFINEDPDRALQVQLLVERCSSSFDGLLMIVATGQAALQTTAVLQRLIDRFSVQVQLSDTDVDGVIRQVLLRKKPERLAELRAELEADSGEIARHLAGARIAPRPGDQDVLAADYPLLPARRRFWESVLRSVDRAGKAGQLRSQLRVVHDANRLVAESSVGTVVPADFIYDDKSADMLQTGVLLRNLEQLIKEERENPDNGPLRSRILALIFLISQLPREGFADTGVRPTASHIADLLVDDLSVSGRELRREVPVVLEKLQVEAKILRVEDEYLLQTPAGQEWTKDFQTRRSAFSSDDGRVAQELDSRLRAAFSQVAPAQRPQGLSRTPRRVETHFGDIAPHVDGTVPVWVRTGWDLTEKQFVDLASGLGTESPVVLVYLPKVESDALKGALAEHAAAVETIDTRPAPTTDEGLAARRAMESTRDQASQRVRRLVGEVLHAAFVVQAGGTRVTAGDLASAVSTAVDNGLIRLYPQFSAADSSAWNTVWSRALQSNENCLEAVGHRGPASAHPVCKAILDSIGAVGVSGNDVRKKFEAPPFGWSRDAVHAALAALVLSTEVNAEENGTPIPLAQFRPNNIGKLYFRREGVAVSLPVRLAVLGLLAKAGISVLRNEEASGCAQLLQRLSDLAQEAGGPPPLPAPPSSSLLDDLHGKRGNELILAVHERLPELEKILSTWKSLAAEKGARLEEFAKAERLLAHLDGTHGEPLRAQLEAVKDGRSLLESPNPVTPVLTSITETVRALMKARFTAYNARVAEAIETLDGEEVWDKLDADSQETLLREHGLVTAEVPDLGSTDATLSALDQRPLSAWSDRFAAIDQRLSDVRAAAARRLEPHAHRVSVPRATLRTNEDVEKYLSEFRDELLEQLAEHRFLII